MTLNKKQIGTIRSFPESYIFRESVQRTIDDYLQMAREIILLCLQSGLEAKHLFAYMQIFGNQKYKQKALKRYLSMCVPSEKFANYLEKFAVLNGSCNFFTDSGRKRIDFTPQSIEQIAEILNIASKQPAQIEQIQSLAGEYEQSESATIFSMQNLSYLLYILQPEVCPIFDHFTSDNEYLKENFDYNGTYSNYLAIFNEIKSQIEENNMLHISWIIHLRNGYNIKEQMERLSVLISEAIFDEM